MSDGIVHWDRNVVVVSPTLFCIIRWLPLWRTATNPFCSSIRQTCDPERTLSLPNRNLNLSDKDLIVEPASDLRRVRRLEEKGQGLD